MEPADASRQVGAVKLEGLPATEAPENKTKMTRTDLVARQISEHAELSRGPGEPLEGTRSSQTAELAEPSGSARHSNRYRGALAESRGAFSPVELVESGRDDGARRHRAS